MFDLRNIATCYRSKKEHKKAEHYYLKALELASKHKEEDLVADISCLLSELYLRIGDLDKALKYVKPAVEYNDPNDQVAVLSISADIYKAAGMTDSAYARYKRMMSIDDVHAKKFAFKRLADYYLMKNDAARSLSCTKGYEQMLDSISAQSATEELARMDAVFRNQQNEQQISRLKADKSNYQNIVIAVCAVVTFFILACLVIFFYLKMRRLSIRIKVELGQRVTQDEHEHTDEFMRQSKESLRGSHLERIRRELQETDEYKMLNRRLQDESVTNKKLSTDEWRRLEEAVGRYADNFRQSIETVCRLSDHEYKVCLLLRLGIRPSGIAEIMNKTSGAISLIRQRLYERAFDQKASPDAWDSFIFSL